jgi:hypothetical protein
MAAQTGVLAGAQRQRLTWQHRRSACAHRLKESATVLTPSCGCTTASGLELQRAGGGRQGGSN